MKNIKDYNLDTLKREKFIDLLDFSLGLVNSVQCRIYFYI